jgi:2-haloacid dehalogenase
VIEPFGTSLVVRGASRRYLDRYVEPGVLVSGDDWRRAVAGRPSRGADDVSDLDFSRFEALTFDCYGTLIDWEAGILAGLRPVLARRGVNPSDDELLEVYARFESVAEAGPYLRYRTVLGRCLGEVVTHYGGTPEPAEIAAFGDSVGDWPAFADSAAALATLHERYRLGVITNCDDDLFARSATRLRAQFECVVTAQSAGSYKPSRRNFELALERIGLPPDRILHIAQSLFHDHVPAKAMGLTTVWIDRRHDRPGFGATPPAEATPDATFADMASFAVAATTG